MGVVRREKAPEAKYGVMRNDAQALATQRLVTSITLQQTGNFIASVPISK